ncbi:N-acyl-D-amino-acid deacylase family protein [Sphingomonas montanisoli]|uniref:Amidohydrolase family protein n=1 Tax=Sphingomonas montanisoli TaxID=2606412 RepID=A0A5D9CEX0_9SPHN|nr:amidohydrolase family protein [Sphingomonas montanisoli]TZG28635.1 amidohydrolase family protein [Sphingomonas montanisoli]
MAETAYDLVIRGGTVVDGSGGERFVADVAVKDGRIAALGEVRGTGAQEIDATGLIVTPGFVDVHTHYDGQALWDERMQPSSWHGVTTIVMGNCGVGFAPCKPEDRERLVRLMEGVEDIPNPVMTEGLPWNWLSFPDYLDAIEERRFDVDIGTQLPHAALRTYVMGERATCFEQATEADINAMAAIAKRAVEAGALGFSTSRTINHKTPDGEHTPTLKAAERELIGIAKGLAAAGKGTLQMICDFDDVDSEFALMRHMVEESGRPLSFSLMQKHERPEDWRRIVAHLGDAVDAGLPMKAQVAARGVGALQGLELTYNPFIANPVFREIIALPHAEKVAKLSDPIFRERLLEANRSPDLPAGLRNFSRMYILARENTDYEPRAEDSIAGLAEARGVEPAEIALDHMLSDGGRGLIYTVATNYAHGNLDHARELLLDPNTIPGLSDGGAHMGIICDGSFPTQVMLWAKRTRGEGIGIEELVQMQANDTAQALGLADRGRIEPGLRADLNIIDLDALSLYAPEVRYDLPTGARRLVQRAEGYRWTIVAGEVTYRDGEPTDALPGRLVRGARGKERIAAAA